MSIKIMSWVFENGPSDPSERLVLLALADYAADNGEWSPSMIGIAAKAGMTERGARGVVRRLEAAGWIEVKVGGGRRGRSHYRITMRNPEQQTRNDKPGMINPEHGDAMLFGEHECQRPEIYGSGHFADAGHDWRTERSGAEVGILRRDERIGAAWVCIFGQVALTKLLIW